MVPKINFDLSHGLKVFHVEISGKKFTISKYTNLSYFGSKLLTGKISINQAKDNPKKILEITNELGKKNGL